MAGPLVICFLIFLAFCVIMVLIAYSFRVRSRCVAAEMRRRSVTSSNLHRGSFARTDLPPSYSSILPPPYEQATTDTTTFSSSSTSANNRNSTSSATAPLVNRYSTISSSTCSSAAQLLQGGCSDHNTGGRSNPYVISSPGMSSSDSYGSILTRSFILTPSDHSPSLTDLTTTDLTAASIHMQEEQGPSSRPHDERKERY